MPSRRSRKSHVIAVQAMELGFAAPQVIAHRVMRMAVAGSSPSLRDRKEFYLMGAEKVAAFYESWNAMLLEMYCANLKSLSTAPLFWFSWPTSMGYSRAASTRFQRAALAVLGKGVAPIHRRAVANAKRLSHVRGR